VSVLSVVIPTHQRRALVERLLGALAAQRLDRHEFEVVIVADGCTDGTADLAATWGATLPVRVIEQPQGGLAAARNRGASETSGGIIVFCDDDVVPGPEFLHELRDECARGADIVLPLVRVAHWVPDVLLAREQRAWDARVAHAMRGGRVAMDHVHFIATAVRRESFEALGGFDASFTRAGAWGKEDTELAYRLLAAGYRVVCRDDLVLDSDCVTAPRTALRRGRDLGRNDVRFARKHPELAATLFRDQLADSRIVRAVGRVIMAAPRAAPLLALPRPLIVRAIERGWVGGLLYRLWLIVWAVEWWGGVVDAGGREIAGAYLHE
jgi:glycosyltransferase involved in cell wall biosynthesis